MVCTPMKIYFDGFCIDECPFGYKVMNGTVGRNRTNHASYTYRYCETDEDALIAEYRKQQIGMSPIHMYDLAILFVIVSVIFFTLL